MGGRGWKEIEGVEMVGRGTMKGWNERAFCSSSSNVDFQDGLSISPQHTVFGQIRCTGETKDHPGCRATGSG